MRDFKGYTMNDLRGHIKEHLSQVQYKAMEGFKRPLFEDWVKSEAEDGRPCEEDSFLANDIKLDPNWLKHENIWGHINEKAQRVTSKP